jgi:hypothetical protein
MKEYQIIYADPAWQYKSLDDGSGIFMQLCLLNILIYGL